MKWNRFFKDTRMYKDSVICEFEPENSTPLEFNIPPQFAKFDESGVWIDSRTKEEIMQFEIDNKL